MTTIRQVDAFTSVPFKGNPAGVCILDGPADEGWMQSVAAEMNVAETAFLWPESDAFRLRWFTPATEVELCGHATLASAHALWESGTLPQDRQALFNTLSGRLSADREDEWIVLDFPVEAAIASVEAEPISAAISNPVIAACRNRFDLLAELASADEVRNLTPDLRAISALGCRGLIVTAASDDDRYDFLSRFFGPAVGVDEDPVTGSAHCFLGPFWAEKLGRSSLTGFQASARGGVVSVEIHGDRARLKGQAVTVLEGHLFS
jgi:PhzF family phenazine biosynthesis protein